MSVGTVVAVIMIGGVAGPALLALVAVLLPAALTGVLPSVVRLSVVLALPLAISVALVNIFFTPGGSDPVAELGPLRVTGEGITVAIEVVVRVFAMAGAVMLFYLTTRPSELVASLQVHGVPARVAFVIHNAVAMIPRLADRASEVAAAQRARGLDSEGGLLPRARGISALAVPSVLGAISEAETRALALEARGFTKPGSHTLLWAPADSTMQRVARWGIAIALVLLLAARVFA